MYLNTRIAFPASLADPVLPEQGMKLTGTGDRVLEARIFLPNPADLAWFARGGGIACVLDTIKPLVLPMLAEAKLLRGAARVKAQEKQVVVGGTGPPRRQMVCEGC